MDIGSEIRRLRTAKGLTLEQVGTAIGAGRSYVYQIESGRRSGLTADALFRLAAVLGVECGHFRPFVSPDLADPAAMPQAEPPPRKPRGRPKKATPPDPAPAEVPPGPPGKPKRGKKPAGPT